MRDTTSGRMRGSTERLDEAARELRQRSTPAERVMWQALRGHRLDGLGFRHQHPIGPFVVDFACPTKKLIVEIDGSVHGEQIDQDRARSELLSLWGWTVNRFSNERVFSDLQSVLRDILLAARSLTSVR